MHRWELKGLLKALTNRASPGCRIAHWKPIMPLVALVSGPSSLYDTFSGDDRSHAMRPLQHDRWSKGKDGFLITDIWQAEPGSLVSVTPSIWLQQTEEKMHLCAYQHKSLTLILLIPVSSVINGEQGILAVKQLVLEIVSPPLMSVLAVKELDKILFLENIQKHVWGQKTHHYLSCATGGSREVRIGEHLSWGGLTT
ncbi:hypothetical protein NL676_024075 [Syzygium grande]|nr:hypothetical protein NL676_024075 [Syzygium grande]